MGGNPQGTYIHTELAKRFVQLFQNIFGQPSTLAHTHRKGNKHCIMKACLSSTEHFIWINSLKPQENPSRNILPASSPFFSSKNSSTEGLSPHLRTHLNHPGTNRYYLDLNYNGLIINHYITVLCLFGEIEEYFHFTFLQVLNNT